MKYPELRRLAIRLAKHTNEHGDSYCGECRKTDYHDGSLRHTHDCPIAELEAEEAAGCPPGLKLSIGGVDFETVPVPAWKLQGISDSGEDWIAELTGAWQPISFDMKDGSTGWTGYVRKVPVSKKAAGKFEGEFGEGHDG